MLAAQPTRARIVRPLVFFLATLAAIFSAPSDGLAAAGWSQRHTRLAQEEDFAFAIGDLDGDGKPDFVFADALDAAPGIVRYAIRTRLSRGAWGTVELAAPAGKLWIRLADLTGNGALDVSVGRKLDGPVAVLLNDGRGNFDLARVSASQDVLDNSERSWSRDEAHLSAGSILVRMSESDCLEKTGAFVAHDFGAEPFASHHTFAAQTLVSFAAERAPPASINLYSSRAASAHSLPSPAVHRQCLHRDN